MRTDTSFFAAPFNGRISVQTANKQIYESYFGFSQNVDATATAPGWIITPIQVTAMQGNQDADGTKHATLTSYVFFSDKAHTNRAAVVQCEVRVPAQGAPTVGLKVTDYFDPSIVLYSTGTDTDGKLLQTPITYGTIYLSL